VRFTQQLGLGDTERVSSGSRTADRVLYQLQALCRMKPSGALDGRSGKVPSDLATDAFRVLSLSRDEDRLLREAEDTLLSDLRFEYLDKTNMEQALWRFVCQSFIERKPDHVPQFIE